MLNVICASSMRGILWDTMAWERSAEAAAAVAQKEATRNFHSEGERISISFIQKLIVQKCTSVLVAFCSAELSSVELCRRIFCRVGVCILRRCASSRNECQWILMHCILMGCIYVGHTKFQ